jgi:exopolysaccharide production protein ExoQ
MILDAPGSTTTGTPAQKGAAVRPANVLGAAPPDGQDKKSNKAKQAVEDLDSDRPHLADAAAQLASDRAAGRYTSWLAWFGCFVSFLGLQLNQTYGTISILIFLAPWVLLIGNRIPMMINGVVRERLMIILPIFATFSALWSPDPQSTMKLGAEYAVTVGIGIAAATLFSQRLVITSLLAALSFMTLAGLAVAFRNSGFAGLHGTVGLYGSKNIFASSAAIQFIAAYYLFRYARRSQLDRLIALGFVAVALLGVYSGHSAGSTVSLGATLLLGIGLQIIRRSGAASVVSLTIGLFAGLTMLVIIGADVLFSDSLHLLGKDTTLTGRTEIWSAGFEEIKKQPLLGIGYQAFWRVGYPPAEKLWAMFGIENKTGFNFHNEYVNMTVGLGILGLMLAVYVLFNVTTSSIKRRLREPETLNSAVHALFFFFFFLTFVEQEFFYQFNISAIVLCLAWSDRLRKPAPIVKNTGAVPLS